jgi:WD40 repeat protein
VGYEVVAELGRGGMGIVYQARQLSVNRTVAVKMLLPDAQVGSPRLARFQAEARAVALIQHPNIVQLYDVGEQDGRPFLVLEFVGGGSLRQRLGGVPQPPLYAAQLVEILARAIHAAHQRGVVHRDLTTGNILHTNDGLPKISDFGLAKIPADEGVPKTQSGAIIGTPSYMAPEQAGGKTHEIGKSVDIYALGAVLYELLTGRPPFRGESAVDTILQVLSDDPVPPKRLQPKVPRDLETICLKCLEKVAGKRYASALALAEDLQAFSTGRPIVARPISVLARGVKWAKRRPAVAVLLAALGFVAAVGVAAIVVLWQRAELAQLDARALAVAEGEARGQAQEALERAERTLYFASMNLSERAWQDHRLEDMEQSLTQCPGSLRRWEWHYFEGLLNTEQLLLDGKGRGAMAVSLRADGKRLATGYRDGTLLLWDAVDGRQLLQLPGHSGQVTAVAFSPHDHTLASAGTDRTVKLWNLETGKVGLELHHENEVFGLAFHPRLNVLVAATGIMRAPGRPGQLIVWNLDSGKRLNSFQDHQGTVNCVSYSPDGRFLASGGEDRLVLVREATTGEIRHRLSKEGTDSQRQRADSPRALAFNDASRPRGLVLKLHSGGILSLAFDASGRQLLTGSSNGQAILWDAETGKELHSLRGHEAAINSVAFSPSGKVAASAGYDRVIRLWSVETGREIRSYQGHRGEINSLAYGPQDTRLASAADDGTVRVWDATQSQESCLIRGMQDNVFGIAFHPNGQELATATGNLFNPTKPGEIKLWDIANRRLLRTLRGHHGGIGTVAYSPDGRWLCSGGADGMIKVWDAVHGEEVKTLRGHQGIIGRVTWSPDGRWIVSVSGHLLSPSKPGEVKLWDAATGLEKLSFAGHQASLTCVAFHPDGTRFATGGLDGTLRTWDMTSGQELRLLRVQQGGILAIAYSPNGHRLAAGTGEFFQPMNPGVIQVWDADTGESLHMLRGHSQQVSGIGFMPDGERLVSGSRDATVKVWDLQTGQLACSLRADSKYVTNIAISPDGKRIASANWDSTVNLWETRNPRLEP